MGQLGGAVQTTPKKDFVLVRSEGELRRIRKKQDEIKLGQNIERMYWTKEGVKLPLSLGRPLAIAPSVNVSFCIYCISISVASPSSRPPAPSHLLCCTKEHTQRKYTYLVLTTKHDLERSLPCREAPVLSTITCTDCIDFNIIAHDRT